MKGLTHFNNQTIKVLLATMCACVGADPQTIDFTEPNWYWKYTWTSKQEESYKSWFIDYFTNNKKELQDITSFIASSNKKRLEKLANEWIFQYGWKTENL